MRKKDSWSGVEQKGDYWIFFQVFLLWAKNIFADLHVSGNSKTFLPLYFFLLRKNSESHFKITKKAYTQTKVGNKYHEKKVLL
jgi:hypothetical protein